MKVLVDCDSTKYTLYKDSLIISFNELSNDSKVILWDNYLESNDSISKKVFCEIIAYEIDDTPLKVNPYNDEFYRMQSICKDKVKVILESHHFDPSTISILAESNVKRFKVWDTKYKYYVKVKYKNLFNTSVVNKFSFTIDRHYNIIDYTIE